MLFHCSHLKNAFDESKGKRNFVSFSIESFLNPINLFKANEIFDWILDSKEIFNNKIGKEIFYSNCSHSDQSIFYCCLVKPILFFIFLFEKVYACCDSQQYFIDTSLKILFSLILLSIHGTQHKIKMNWINYWIVNNKNVCVISMQYYEFKSDYQSSKQLIDLTQLIYLHIVGLAAIFITHQSVNSKKRWETKRNDFGSKHVLF